MENEVTLKRKKLVEVAKDINQKLGLEPQIPTSSATKVADLKKLIAQAGKEAVDPLDPLNVNTWVVLSALGANPRVDEDEKVAETEEKAVEEVVEEVEAEKAEAEKAEEEYYGKDKIKTKEGKPSQVQFIITELKATTPSDELIKKLASAFEKKESWARSRLATYEKAYGKRGERDGRV